MAHAGPRRGAARSGQPSSAPRTAPATQRAERASRRTPPPGTSRTRLPSPRRRQLDGTAGSTTSPPGTSGRSRPTRDVDRVGQAADRAAALVELADVDEHDLEAPLLQLRADARSGQAGITTVRPTTTELAQKVVSASSSVSTSGSGTRSSSAAADGVVERRRGRPSRGARRAGRRPGRGGTCPGG